MHQAQGRLEGQPAEQEAGLQGGLWVHVQAPPPPGRQGSRPAGHHVARGGRCILSDLEFLKSETEKNYRFWILKPPVDISNARCGK